MLRANFPIGHLALLPKYVLGASALTREYLCPGDMHRLHQRAQAFFMNMLTGTPLNAPILAQYKCSHRCGSIMWEQPKSIYLEGASTSVSCYRPLKLLLQVHLSTVSQHFVTPAPRRPSLRLQRVLPWSTACYRDMLLSGNTFPRPVETECMRQVE